MHTHKSRLDYLYPVVTFIAIISIWQILDVILHIQTVILPSPLEIVTATVQNTEKLAYHTSVTLLESLLGFVIGSLGAIALAIMFVVFARTKKALYPYAIALKATPLYALAPLLVIWFGNGLGAKIVMAALVAFFPVLVSTVKGLTALDQEALDLFRSFDASKKFLLIKLRFPNALPYVFPALKIASTLAVVGATIAEFTGATKGIGHLIVTSSYYLETSLMFAGIIMISLGGIAFFYCIEALEKKIVFWQRHD